MDSHDVALSFVEDADLSPGHRWSKIFAYCLIFDVLLGWCAWTELKYHNAVEVAAKFMVVGKVEYHSRNGGHRILHRLRYEFRDPQTGQRRQNTVEIVPALVPAGQTVMVQHLPGEMPASRLVIQARPMIVTVFTIINSILGLALCGVIAWLAWEANTKPLTRQQRWVRERKRSASLRV